MPKGYLVLVLHAHLPFVRHPEYESFLEERWLFEAISETYLPLLRAFTRLENDDVPINVTLSLSPSLLSMLTDSFLMQRYVRYSENQLALVERELERTADDPALHQVVRMYHRLVSQNLYEFTEVYDRDILRGFGYLYTRGKIELITTAGTYPYLPVYEHFPEAINAQIDAGIRTHERVFGKAPRGFWLPECGYFPGLERQLSKHGLQYFFVAAHGLLFSDDIPVSGVYAPTRCPNGTYAFGRDLSSAGLVWSPTDGYPGNPAYRDFYRDIGFDLPVDALGAFATAGSDRVNTGLKYYCVTGDTADKAVYNPGVAEQQAGEHAADFVAYQIRQTRRLCTIMDRPPVITCPYTAELFGHWWFEGVQWIEAVIRNVHHSGDDLALITPSAFLKSFPDQQTAAPVFSSWGNKGYSEVWLDGSNDWIYRHIQFAIERMLELCDRFPNETGLKERALNQAAREVLMAQASDWPMIMRSGTAVGYATRRLKEHLFNFSRIYDHLSRGNLGTEWLTKLERRNNLFQNLDYRIFKRSNGLI